MAQTPHIKINETAIELRLDFRAIRALKTEHGHTPMGIINELQNLDPVIVGDVAHAALVSGNIVAGQPVETPTPEQTEGALNANPALFGEVAMFAIHQLTAMFESVNEVAEKKPAPPAKN